MQFEKKILTDSKFDLNQSKYDDDIRYMVNIINCIKKIESQIIKRQKQSLLFVKQVRLFHGYLKYQETIVSVVNKVNVYSNYHYLLSPTSFAKSGIKIYDTTSKWGWSPFIT